MGLVGLLLGLERPVPHVLHRQGRGDHQNFVQRLAVARLEDHAAHARVERQSREFHAHGREFIGIVHRAQFGQQLVAVGDRAARGRLDERELGHVAQVQRLHAQDHARQRGAQDFRVGEARPAVEVGFVVEPDADAVGHAAAAACPLVGRRLAHGFDQQLLDLAAEAVALHARGAGVDHITDARHRERCLGHVGGQHDAAARMAFEDAVLLGLREAREQRQHLGAAHHRLVRQVLAQVIGGLADLALARQEDEDVARRVAGPEFVHAVGDGLVQAVVAAFLERPVPLLHREGAAGYVDDGSRPLRRLEVLREPLGVDGGRGDHDFQVGPARQDLAQVAQQEVDVQAAFVRLVDDDGVVGRQQRVGLRLGQQDAVRHQLDGGIARQAVLEAHLVTHHVAQRRLQLFGDAFGDAAGRDPARLRVADQAPLLARPGIAPAAAERQRDLGQLGGLARAGLAADDDDLVGLHRGHDLFALARNRQAGREVDAQRRWRGRLSGHCGRCGLGDGGFRGRGTCHRDPHYPNDPLAWCNAGHPQPCVHAAAPVKIRRVVRAGLPRPAPTHASAPFRHGNEQPCRGTPQDRSFPMTLSFHRID